MWNDQRVARFFLSLKFHAWKCLTSVSIQSSTHFIQHLVICHLFDSVVLLYRISLCTNQYCVSLNVNVNVNKINELYALLEEQNRSHYISSVSCGCPD